MESGYEVFWTEHALAELQSTFEYLEQRFTEKELIRLSLEIEKIIALLSVNPLMFPVVENKNQVRKVAVMKLNTLYYCLTADDTVEILSFFSNRQSPQKRKIQS